MTQSAKKQKKGHITEENMANLLHRYSAQKVLALLQEVSQSAEPKMDWNALVQKTATGITNPREYQMLWRHIAYCEELLEKVDDGAQPLDDDSDLEYELEAYPAVSAESSAEAAACVKVLIGSGLPGDSKVPNIATVEAPLTINIPTNGQSSKSFLGNSQPASMQGKIITVPVSVQKQPFPQGSVQKQLVPAGLKAEGSDANGLTSTNFPRRKRKPWSEEEDLELMAAVRKCGEGNWANILKNDFKGDRTASQLSQRWTIIRKRKSNASIGGQSAGTQVSDAHLAVRRAIDIALPHKPTVGNGATTTSNADKSNPSNNDNAVANSSPSQPQQSHSTPPGGNTVSSKTGTSSPLPNPRPLPKKAPLKPLLNTESSSMVTKVAVAAGARIASQSTAASLYKAAQANNAIHIMPKGVSNLIKTSTTTTTTSSPPPPTHVGPNRTMPFGSQTVRPNLTRPINTPGSISLATGSQPVRSTFARPTVLPPPSKPNSSSAQLSQASQRVTTAAVSQSNEVKKEEKTREAMKAPPPPPHLMTRPANSGSQQIPLPASSSAGMVVSNLAASKEKEKEKSQCTVNTEKEKVAIGNSEVSVVINAAENSKCIDDLKKKNDLVVVSGKREEIASEKQNLPDSKVVGSGKLEVKID